MLFFFTFTTFKVCIELGHYWHKPLQGGRNLTWAREIEQNIFQTRCVGKRCREVSLFLESWRLYLGVRENSVIRNRTWFFSAFSGRFWKKADFGLVTFSSETKFGLSILRHRQSVIPGDSISKKKKRQKKVWFDKIVHNICLESASVSLSRGVHCASYLLQGVVRRRSRPHGFQLSESIL